MKNTAFTEKHIALGAKMAPFAGYNMPIQYSSINEEHATVREGVGVFDVSHMGEIWVYGPKALEFLQYVSTNDLSVVYPGKAQYNCFPNGKGGIVDDFISYCFGPEKYLLAVNAANTDKDWENLCKYAPKFGLEIGKDLVNKSDETCQLAIQGPKAMEAMQKLTKEPIMDMEYYTFKELELAGIPVIFSTTGYTGSGGCEVYADNKYADQLWTAVFEAGEEFGIKPIGLGARDTLRLEMGYCLYGNDIDDTTSPLEAGLGWITKFNDVKGDFIDKEFLLAQKAEGIKRKLVGFELIDKGIARHEMNICDAEGNKIGHVTSGTMGPSVKKAVGMGYVDVPFHKTGSEIYIEIRGKLLKAVVVKAPFYQK